MVEARRCGARPKRGAERPPGCPGQCLIPPRGARAGAADGFGGLLWGGCGPARGDATQRGRAAAVEMPLFASNPFEQDVGERAGKGGAVGRPRLSSARRWGPRPRLGPVGGERRRCPSASRRCGVCGPSVWAGNRGGEGQPRSCRRGRVALAGRPKGRGPSPARAGSIPLQNRGRLGPGCCGRDSAGLVRVGLCSSAALQDIEFVPCLVSVFLVFKGPFLNCNIAKTIKIS